jgi:acyl-CoA thioester hydrolase
MPRIKLTEQKDYPFHFSVVLQPRDINYGGHLGNDSLISLLNTARAAMLRSMGMNELNLGDGRTSIIMADMAVNYKKEAFMFDELRIDTCIGEMGKNSFRIFQRVVQGETVVALAESGIITLDHADRKIAPVPESFTKAIETRRN